MSIVTTKGDFIAAQKFNIYKKPIAIVATPQIIGSHKIVQQRHMALRFGCVEAGGVTGAKYA